MIRPLKKSDIKGLNSLVPQDWNSDLEQNQLQFYGQEYFHAFVMADPEKIISLGNLFFNADSAWLANIIVAEKCRGLGLGSEMTAHLMDFAVAQGYTSMLLLATAIGQPMYQKLGFKTVCTYQKFVSPSDSQHTRSKAVRSLENRDLFDVHALDTLATGESRMHLLFKFYEEGLGYFQGDKLFGFYLPHFGRGLVIASDPTAGAELLQIKHAEKDCVTMVPESNLAAIDLLTEANLTRGEPLYRMVYTQDVDWKPEYIFSYGSGGFG